MDFLTEDLDIKQLPNLPQKIQGSSMFTHNGWNNSRKCLQFHNGTWREHSTLNKERVGHSAIATQTATFIFGGCYSAQTYEYIPKDSTK